jgi:hypothetical protein
MRKWVVFVGALALAGLVEIAVTSQYQIKPRELADRSLAPTIEDGTWRVRLPSGTSLAMDATEWRPEWEDSRQFIRAWVCQDFPADAFELEITCVTATGPIEQVAMFFVEGFGRWQYAFTRLDQAIRWARARYRRAALSEQMLPGIQSAEEAVGVLARQAPASSIIGFFAGIWLIVSVFRRKPATTQPQID